jgi:UDP-N-acetyl-D-glucosamine dehydrogenase
VYSSATARDRAPSVGEDRSRIPYAQLRARIADRSATVAVVGLGYVGLPILTAAGREGFNLLGIDTSEAKIASLQRGRSYVADVPDAQVSAIEVAEFATDHSVLVSADVVIVAVPTPLRDGGPDLSLVLQAGKQIAQTLRPGQLVVLESTTYPGTTQDIFRPVLESSGLIAGRDFALAYSPERINPGGSWTLRETPKVVAGITEADTDVAMCFYATLVEKVVRTSSPREAEMAKLIENTFRQVNIALVNELATIAPSIGVDIWEALDAAATKPFGYLPFWPGAGVGGHCIAVDPSYLSWKVQQQLGFGVGFIDHARMVNNRMPAHVAQRVSEVLNSVGKATRGSRVLVLGLAYKPGVNDVRESPAVEVLEHLIAAGAVCSYHDEFVPKVTIRPKFSPRNCPEPNAETVLRSSEINPSLIKKADCVVILTSHPDIDFSSVVADASLVFDATGITRDKRAPNVVLL